MNRADLRRMARIRLKEAAVLLRAKCFDGAYYLCGYAVECALKACIAKSTRRSDFPDLEKVRDSYTHKFPVLLKVVELTSIFDAECASNPLFAAYWITAKDWSETARYAEHGESKARNFHRAITDRDHGIMRWIRKHW